MVAKGSRLPSYRLHKPTGLAVVTIGGHDSISGNTRVPKVGRIRSRHRRMVGNRPTSDRGRRWSRSHRERDGSWRISAMSTPITSRTVSRHLSQSTSAWLSGLSVNSTVALWPGSLGLSDSRPSAKAMIESDLCRSEVNKRVRRIIRAFKWAVGEEMVTPSVHHGLKAVHGLRRGRDDVRESEPVRAGPRCVRGCDSALRCATSMDDGRASAAFGHAAREKLLDAIDRHRHVRPDLGLPARKP